MKFISFRRDGRDSFGRLDGDEVVDLGTAGMTLSEALERHPDPLDIGALEGERVVTAGLEMLPPIPAPRKVLCVGFNFRAHADETGRQAPAEPTLFSRFADSFVGHRQPLVRPSVSRELDWEGELAVVLGRRAWELSAENALDAVAGYVCMGENSVRDWQGHGTQATAGKNFWRTGSFGPALVTPDEVGNPGTLRLETRLNGETVQQASLAELIFSVEEILAYITSFTPLGPGDVVAMGTPSGTGFRREPPRFLEPGDLLEVEVERVGVLSNPVIDLANARV